MEKNTGKRLKKRKKRWVYATLRTKTKNTVPVAVFEASPAVTVIVVLPKPNTMSFTVAVLPTAIATESVLCAPRRIKPPVKFIFHVTVAFTVPVFLITALMPSGPLIDSIEKCGRGAITLTAAVSVAVLFAASVTVRVAV